ncbi:helix-turn-helix transcriptional regulator [Tissierella sp.]|uniref:helix-turn-helix domain-containing protein n=1 Tax=Tissierella sp. TaxID=41274 RepID=UPI0030413EAF
MPENKLLYLGNRIRSARKNCGLTQQELADQTGLAVKTIQDIEKGRKNTTYETLSVIIERLGISANMLFPSKISVDDEEIQRFIGKFQSCTSENRKILLNTLDCLAEQLLAFHNNFSDE